MKIVRRAIEEPLRWIAGNAGLEGSIVVEKVKQGRGAFGFNADRMLHGRDDGQHDNSRRLQHLDDMQAGVAAPGEKNKKGNVPANLVQRW